jgi:putative hydrolase of the HAD superfamily
MSSRSGPVVVLDLDDTVFSERQYAVSGFKEVGDFVQRQFGIRGFAETSIALFESGVRGKVFDRACLELKLPTSETLISALVQIYRAHWPSIELFADARAFLRSLEGAVSLAVLSDGPLVSQVAKARALGMQHWCSVQIFTDVWGPAGWKPAEIGFRQIQAFLPSSAGYAYIADNPLKDFIAPKELGWRTVRVRREGGLYAPLEAESAAAAADLELADLSGLRLDDLR